MKKLIVLLLLIVSTFILNAQNLPCNTQVCNDGTYQLRAGRGLYCGSSWIRVDVTPPAGAVYWQTYLVDSVYNGGCSCTKITDQPQYCRVNAGQTQLRAFILNAYNGIWQCKKYYTIRTIFKDAKLQPICFKQATIYVP